MKSNPLENGREVARYDKYERLPKKTRDLPNLSECQACGIRVDACAGNARTRLLYSEWRVLLLCKRCFVWVESSQMCSYCFKEASMEDCVRCYQCDRRVHSSCFQEYRIVPSIPGKDFLICVDCWVPNIIATKRWNSKGKRVCKHGMGLKSGDARVSSGEDGRHLLENIGNGALGVCRNNTEAVKSMELDSRKTILDHCVLDLEISEAGSCESVQDRNMNHKSAAKTGPSKSILRVYERTRRNRDKKREEKLIDQNETSRIRCNNVYTRNGWQSGKYLWITNGSLAKGESTMMKGESSNKWNNVYTRNGWQSGKYLWITNSCHRKGEAAITKGQERSAKWLKVYVRKRWKNGKRSCSILKNEGEVHVDAREEEQERCTVNNNHNDKLNDDSQMSSPRQEELGVLTNKQKNDSATKLTKVYRRVRFKEQQIC